MPSILSGPAFRAAGTIAPCRWVKLSTTDRRVAQVSSATADFPFGLAQEGQKGTPGVTGSDTAVAAEAGDQVHIVTPGNIGMSEAGGTITAGDIVKPDADGKSVTTGSTAATQYKNGGYAMSDASSGHLFPVFVWPMTVTYPA